MERGLSVEVINARFVKPLDEQLILGVFERRLPVVVVEDNSIVGGFGSAVIELASSRGYPVDSMRRIGVPDAFIEHDSPEALREKLGLTAEGIAEAVAFIAKTRKGENAKEKMGNRV